MGTVSISDEACLKGKKCKGRRENQKKMNTAWSLKKTGKIRDEKT